MKSMKKIVSLLLSLLMIVTMAVGTLTVAFAASGTITLGKYGTLDYECDNGKKRPLEITIYVGGKVVYENNDYEMGSPDFESSFSVSEDYEFLSAKINNRTTDDPTEIDISNNGKLKLEIWLKGVTPPEPDEYDLTVYYWDVTTGERVPLEVDGETSYSYTDEEGEDYDLSDYVDIAVPYYDLIGVAEDSDDVTGTIEGNVVINVEYTRSLYSYLIEYYLNEEYVDEIRVMNVPSEAIVDAVPAWEGLEPYHRLDYIDTLPATILDSETVIKVYYVDKTPGDVEIPVLHTYFRENYNGANRTNMGDQPGANHVIVYTEGKDTTVDLSKITRSFIFGGYRYGIESLVVTGTLVADVDKPAVVTHTTNFVYDPDYEYEIDLTYLRTLPAPGDDNDDDDGGGGTPIIDPTIPLGPGPSTSGVVTIIDPNVALGNLPQSGGGQSALAALGLVGMFGSLVSLTKKKKKEK